MRVALLQGPSGTPRTGLDSLQALEGAARRAAAGGARLLVASEMFLTGYALGDPGTVRERAESAGGPGARAVARIAAEHGLAIAYGYPEAAGGDVYNSVQLIGPHGARLANYRKTHLFGDFERKAFSRGHEAVVQADFDGLRVGLLICYDVEFPEAVRAHAVAGTELLLVPTALMRPYGIVPDTLIPARAWENQLYVAYANRCGPEGEFDFAGLSSLAAPDGTVRARAGYGADLVLGDVDTEQLTASRAANPYLEDRRPELYGLLV